MLGLASSDIASSRLLALPLMSPRATEREETGGDTVSTSEQHLKLTCASDPGGDGGPPGHRALGRSEAGSLPGPHAEATLRRAS